MNPLRKLTTFLDARSKTVRVIGEEITRLNRVYDSCNTRGTSIHHKRSASTTRTVLTELAACMSTAWNIARELGIEPEVRAYVQEVEGVVVISE